MGVWFLSSAVSNMLAGQLATFYPDGTTKHIFGFPIASLEDFFMVFVIMSGIAAIALTCMTPVLKQMMKDE